MDLIKQNNETDKIAGISQLQFICCCLVVFIHANPIASLGLELNNLSNPLEILMYHSIEIITKFAEISVATFYLISGYLFYKAFDSYEDWIGKIRKRIKSVVVPYLLWSTITWLFFVMLTHIPLIANHMNMGKVSLDIQSIFHDIFMSTFAPLWYLRYLFIYMIISIFLKKIVDYKNVALVFIVVIMSANLITGYEYIGFWTWIPFFLIGACFQVYGVHFKLKYIKLIFILSIVTMIVSYVNNESVSGVYVYIYRVLISISAFQYFRFYKKSSYKWRYDCSMVIYCGHIILVNVLEKIFFLIFGKSILIATVTYFSVTAISVYIISFLSKHIYLQFPRCWSLISGNRQLKL